MGGRGFQVCKEDGVEGILGDILQGDLGHLAWLSMPSLHLASFGYPCVPICWCFTEIDADVGQRGSGSGQREEGGGKRRKGVLRASDRSQRSRGRGLLQKQFHQSPHLIGASLFDLVKNLIRRVPRLSG